MCGVRTYLFVPYFLAVSVRRGCGECGVRTYLFVPYLLAVPVRGGRAIAVGYARARDQVVDELAAAEEAWLLLAEEADDDVL